MPAHALVVEDEPHIRELLALHLGLEGVTVSECADGALALEAFGATRFDLVVLDLMLPKIDGLTVCAAIRRSTLNAETPILILTARREESDTVLGLETGADDYLTKPFGVREFVARVRALLRRPRRGDTEAPAVVDAGGVRIDPARRLVHVAGAPVDLTPHEFDVLLLLASNPGIVLLGLPPFLFLVMLKLNYDYIMILFTDELGKKLMVVAVLLQLVGALVIRKIVNIKV